MGKSKSIKELQETNKAFQDYVDQMGEKMDAYKVKMTEEIGNMIQEHYRNFSDKSLLMEGSYSHLTTMSEWSLNSISAIINSCSKALFGSKIPEGAEKKKTDKKVDGAIAGMKERELYIANAAFDIIQGIMSSFSNSTTTSVETKFDGKPLSPGLTLFIAVANNSYRHNSFFSNETITQSIFVFKVYYSIKEGATQSKLSDLESYENQKASYRKQIKKIDERVEQLDVFSENYLQELTKYENIADRLNERLQKIDEEIKHLSPDNVEVGSGKNRELEEYSNIVKKLKEMKAVSYRQWKAKQK